MIKMEKDPLFKNVEVMGFKDNEKVKEVLKKNLPKFKEVNFSNIMWVLGDMADRKEITEEQYEASRKRYLAKKEEIENES